MTIITSYAQDLIFNNMDDSMPEKFDNLGQLNAYFTIKAPYYPVAIRNIFGENGIIPEKNEDELITLGIKIAAKLHSNINDVDGFNNIASNVLKILTAEPITINNMFNAVFSKFNQCTTLDDLKNDLEKHPEYMVGINHFLSNNNVLNFFDHATGQLATNKRWNVNDMDKVLQNALDSTYTDNEENLNPAYSQTQPDNNPTECIGENSDNNGEVMDLGDF
ncbi:MAG TPA: hypothetical protein QKA08_00685 [Candidatus Megaira endosymbiont of Nemacystus decipiens]|nr:hypothetical protein [Candidatus Megaera endosymbiont of Nemacystus decipiens]